MKKYRLTKITVKTREIVSMSKNTAQTIGEDVHTSVCPTCRTTFLTSLPAAERFAGEMTMERAASALQIAKN